jgi:hypothetical protein
VQHLFDFKGVIIANTSASPQFAVLLASCMWLAVAIRLVYLGVLMFVALFSKDPARAERAEAMFRDLLRLFWWRRK